MNLIPEAMQSGKSGSALTSWYGGKAWSSGAVDNDRGMHVFAGVLYKVTGETLYSVASDGAQTSIGTIAGANPCIFADDGYTMRIATGNNDYTLSAGVLSVITDPDLNPGNSVAYLNQQMINDSTGGQFQTSDVGVPGSISSNNFATAESAPDDTVRVYTFNERLYLFGDRSTVETWYNSGSGNPPFDRVQGGTMQVGLSSPYSVASTQEYVYFLGSDATVYRFSASQAEPVSPPVISAEFANYTHSDARAFVVNVEGMSFYVINFITQGKTWAYNEDGNAWFELSTGANEGNYSGTSYAECYGKKLIANGGDILELDADTYTHAGDVMIKERVSAPIISQTGKRIEMSSFTLVMETGVGLVTGQGEDPVVMLSASFDGGKSFTNESTVKIGRLGESRAKVEYFNMGSGYEILIKARISDPVFVSIHSASIKIREAGY
jgi:hypothetical protein